MVSITEIGNKPFYAESAHDGSFSRQAVIVTDRETHHVPPVTQLLLHQGFVVKLIQTDKLFSESRQDPTCDLLLLDVSSLEEKEQTACERIRRNNHQLPIVILSDRNTVEDRIRGFESGADDFIAKPFAHQEVTARLRSLLRRSRPVRSRQLLHYADLTVDLTSRAVYRGEHCIELSRREFDLLAMFLQNPEQILTREQILEQVWRSTQAYGSNVVDVYVNYVRNKTEKDHLPRLIHTIRSKGYMLHRHPGKS